MRGKLKTSFSVGDFLNEALLGPVLLFKMGQTKNFLHKFWIWIQNVPRGSLNFNSDNSQLIQKLVPFRKVIHLEFPKKQNFFINKLQFLVTFTMQLQATKDWHRYNTKIKIFPLKFFKKSSFQYEKRLTIHFFPNLIYSFFKERRNRKYFRFEYKKLYKLQSLNYRCDDLTLKVKIQIKDYKKFTF